MAVPDASTLSPQKKNSSKNQLEIINKLGHDTANTRVYAAATMLSQIKLDSSGDTQTYFLRRLIRGLASSKASSRQGFFSALVELLKQNEAKKDEVVAAARKLANDEFGSKASSTEEGEFLCGRMLFHGALIRSGLLDDDNLASELADILKIAKKRSYLLVAGYQLIVEYLRTVDDAKVFTNTLWPVLKEKVEWTSESLTLESTWLLMELHHRFPKVLSKSFLQESFGWKTLMSDAFLETLAKIMQESTLPLHLVRKHPLFPALLPELQKNKLLEGFWVDHVAPTVTKTSSYRSFIGFTLFSEIVPLLGESTDVSKLLLPNVIEAALTLLSRVESPPEEDAIIYSALSKCAESVRSDPAKILKLVKLLLSHPGSIAFDKLTGGNVVHQLITLGSKEVIPGVAELYKRAVAGIAENGTAFTNQERVYSVQQLAKLLFHPAVQDLVEWRLEMLKFLGSITLFRLKKAVAPLDFVPLPFSKDSVQMLRGPFFRALEIKGQNLQAAIRTQREVALHLNSLLQEASAEPLMAFDSKARASWATVIKEVEKIEAARKKGERKEESVFELLYLQIGFQLFTDSEMACDIISELLECHKRAVEQRSGGKKAKAAKEGEPRWVEVVVDILLSLLSQNKVVLRQVVSSVFTLLCPHMTDEALQIVFDAIQPPKEKNGEDDDDDEEEEEEAEDGEDEEMDAEEESEEDDEENEESEDDNEPEADDNDEDEDAEKVDVDLRDKVKFALGEHAAESDEESIDMDDIEDEDMKKMDAALANVFRVLSKKKSGAMQKKEKKDATAVMHFKIRALDLIDVYLAHNPSAAHVMQIVSFLVALTPRVLKDKSQKPLETRLMSTFTKLVNVKKPQRVESEIDPRAFAALLQTLVDLANSGSPLVAHLSKPQPIFSQSCTLVLKLAQQSENEEAKKEVQDIYLKALDDFFNKSHSLLPMPFFLSAIQSNWPGSWMFLEKLVSCGFDAKVRPFRRTHALALLTALFTNPNIREFQPQKTVAQSLRAIEEKLLTELSDLFDEPEALKARYLNEVLSLLNALRTSQAKVDWEKFKVVLAKFKSNVPKNRHFKDIQRAYNKLATPLGIEVVKGSEKKSEKKSGKSNKPKADFFDGIKEESAEKAQVNGESESKKKKKKASKESLQAKKESKHHAVVGQFEGMEMPSFAGVELGENSTFVNVREEAVAMATPEKATRKSKRNTDLVSTPTVTTTPGGREKRIRRNTKNID